MVPPTDGRVLPISDRVKPVAPPGSLNLISFSMLPAVTTPPLLALWALNTPMKLPGVK